MTLAPRPLVRETATFRDDRLFIVACEDTYAPQQYFDFFEIPRVQIHVVPTEDGRSSPQHVLGRLLAIEHAEYDERWLLSDVTIAVRVRTSPISYRLLAKHGVKG